MDYSKFMKAGQEDVVEINTAVKATPKEIEVDDIEQFLNDQEVEIDITHLVKFMEEDIDMPVLEPWDENSDTLEINPEDLHLENCVTCLHSEFIERADIVILPSGCKMGVQVKFNKAIWCEDFKSWED